MDYVWLTDVDVTAVKMPDELRSEQAVFTALAATIVHPIRISPMKAGDIVAVVGAGPIGLLSVWALGRSALRDFFVLAPGRLMQEKS